MAKKIFKIFFVIVILIVCFSEVKNVKAANIFSGDSSVTGLYRLESGAITTDSSPVVGGNGLNTLTNSSTPVTANDTAKEGSYSGSFVAASSEYLYITDANLSSGFPGKGGTSNTTFAFSLWFKLSSASNGTYVALISKYNATSNQRSFYSRYFYNGTSSTLDMIIGYNSGLSSELKTIYTGDLGTTNWYHLGFSYNGATKAYIAKLVREDGTVMANVSGNYTNTMSAGAGAFALGAYANTVPGGFFNGLEDEVVIFNTAKTTTDFDNIRNGIYGSVPLNVPTLSVPVNGASSVTTDTNLTWIDTNTSPNDSGYYICIGTTNTSPPSSCITVAADVTSISAATTLGLALSDSTTYYWTVKALGDGTTVGDSTYANNFSFSTVTPPSTTYCVDSAGGDDLNTGTSVDGTCLDALPWKTLDKVNNTALYPGDHILLKKGSNWNEQLTIDSSGTASDPIVIDAYGTGVTPIITGTTYAVHANGKNYLSLNNLDLRNASTANINIDTAINIDLNNITSTGSVNGIILDTISGTLTGSGWTVSGTSGDGVNITGTTATLTLSDINVSGGVGNNIYIYNSNLGSGSTINSLIADAATGMNVKIVGVQNLEMIDSVASNATYAGTPATGEGFWVGGGSTNITFTRCTAHNNQWDGFTLKDAGNSNIIHNKCSSYNNGIIAQVSGGAGDGFTAHSDASNLQYNYCLAYGNKNAGFAFVETTSGRVYNSTAYNNGIATSDRGAFYSLNTAGTWTLRNNIFSQNIPYELATSAAEAALINTDYNLYYHPANSDVITLDNGSTKQSWSTYHTTNGKEAHSLYSDPLFISTVTPDFNLQSSLSPALNTGTNLSLTSDFVGTSVPQGSTPDIGAFEYPYHTLTYVAGANGSITGTTSQSVASGSNGSTVIAIPNVGYYFVNWNDGVLTTTRTDLNVTSNHTYIANFNIPAVGGLQYDLSATPATNKDNDFKNAENDNYLIDNTDIIIEIKTKIQYITEKISALLNQNQNKTSASPSVVLTEPLFYGSSGSQVVLLQNILKQLEFFPKEVDSNGNFGPTTLKSVQTFQNYYNIASSGTQGYGFVGPRTRAELNKVIK